MTLDFIGGVILMAAIVVNISVFTNALSISQPARIGLVAAAGLWTGLQLSLYAAGAYQSPLVQNYPLVGPMVVLPPIIAGLAAIFSARVRATLLAVPTELMIGLNAMRVFGSFFLFLAAAGRLSGPFPYSAGWGDVITGLVAIPLAMRVARGSASRHARSYCRRDVRHAVIRRLCRAGVQRRSGLERGTVHALAVDPDRAGAVLPHHPRHHFCPASATTRCGGDAARLIVAARKRERQKRPPFPLLSCQALANTKSQTVSQYGSSNPTREISAGSSIL
jgi:hypothetical protein